jgi:CDP-paratose 2-epimerase
VSKKILITGGCGFLGSNLAISALNKGLDLCVIDNLQRIGSSDNLDYILSKGKFDFIRLDVRDADNIEQAIKSFQPDCIFHLSGQVAMTTSIENPREDFEINTLGTLNVLEAVRKHRPKCSVFYSSTNKVYGDLNFCDYNESSTRYIAHNYPNGFPENIPLEFHSPYGCSKGAADQYMLDYHRIYNLNTCVFRHSSMYGGRQYPTFNQGWISWFCQQALLQKNGKITTSTIAGNGKQVRDVLHVDDMINLYFTAESNIEMIKGNVFNIGGGSDNSLSLLELFKLLGDILDFEFKYICEEPRISDQKVFIADISKAEHELGWKPQVGIEEGIRNMISWSQSILNH